VQAHRNSSIEPRLVPVLFVAVVLVTGLLVPATPALAGGPTLKVIVEGTGDPAALEQAVVALGGTVLTELPIINGFTAEVPVAVVDDLRVHASVAAVTPDGTVRLLGKPPPKDRDGGGDEPDPVPTGSGTSTFGETRYSSELDGSMYHVVEEGTWAKNYWGAGYTGQGVTVALIDSGVVPVDGLMTEGKVINGPDLSFESQADNLRYLDGFGHGTHLAGIIAGRDNSAPDRITRTDSKYFLGMAPDAAVLSVRVADHEGAVDVSQVIAAIDWVVQHRDDNGMNVRVLNLSFGTDSNQSYLLDPLAHAVEQAWWYGIVVVVAAGNDGNVQPLRNPALDPFVIAVGALNTNGTATFDDDTVPDFSNCGTEDRHVDVVAPGVSIVSLRNPNSYADVNYPDARVGDQFFKGTGTSQAAAVVSGAVALILSKKPNLSAYQVKTLLTETARPVEGVHQWCQGSGAIDLKAAFQFKKNPSGVWPYTWSSGDGSLEAARGSFHVQDEGQLLTGEIDIFGNDFNSSAHAFDAMWEQAWDGGTWNGASWSGASWSGASWSGASWSGASWSGASWSSKSWSDNTWNGASWSSASWSGASWSSASWSSRVWSGLSWR
jgi:serine protease AprX